MRNRAKCTHGHIGGSQIKIPIYRRGAGKGRRPDSGTKDMLRLPAVVPERHVCQMRCLPKELPHVLPQPSSGPQAI